MFKHRLIDPLTSGLNKGHNCFFIYGAGVGDYFFYNFYEGILSAHETFKRAFLDPAEKNGDRPIAETYIYITQNKINCFRKDNAQAPSAYSEITESYFTIIQNSDVLDDIQDTPVQSEEARTIQRDADRNHTRFQNDFGRLKDIIRNKKEKTVIYFENFEWLAGLYSSNRDRALEFIKCVKDLILDKNAIVLLSICDIELLRPYHFNMEGSNCVYIGNPTAQEIKIAYLRRYMREVQPGKIEDNVMGEIEDIAQSVASGNKDLRAAIRIYDVVVRHRPDYTMDKKDFEIAIEKILEEKITLDDVVLDTETKDGITRSVKSFLHSDDNKNYRKGLILTGPPGTGKTYLVKAIANEYNCYFMAPTLSDLKGEFIGQSSAKVKRIFEQARANQPTIIFIDEADTIFADRNLAGGSSDSFNLDMVNQFLVEIDGMKTGMQKIFVIAATNRAGVLDNAIRSRLSEVINICLPGKEDRKTLFHKKLLQHSFHFNGKSFSEEIAEKTENMSGRDIDNFVKMLSESVIETPFRKIANLGDNPETRELFLAVLQKTEAALIRDLQSKIPIEIIHPEKISTTYHDIIGYEDIKEKIKRQVQHLTATEKERQDAEKYAIQTPKGILLYGPPGNAKSKLAEATAKEYNLYYIKILSRDFASVHIDQQLQNLQRIFDQTLCLSKICSGVDGILLFFDEFDSLASVNMLNPVIRGTILDYLSNDGINGIRAKYGKILLMAATNFYNALDEALIRKGRIDEHICMSNPPEEQGIQILTACIENDKHVVPLSGSKIKVIYRELLKRIQEKIFRNEYAKIGAQIELLQAERNFAKAKRLKELLQKQAQEYHPSGAEIIDLFQEMKNEAYYLHKTNNTNQLLIDDEVIVKIFGTEDTREVS